MSLMCNMEERQTEQAWTWMRAVTGNAIPASLVVKMISYLIARLVKMSTCIFFPHSLYHIASWNPRPTLLYHSASQPASLHGLLDTRDKHARSRGFEQHLWSLNSWIAARGLGEKGGWGSTSFHSWSLFRKFTLNADSMDEPSNPQNSYFLVNKQKRRDLAFWGKMMEPF